MTGGWHQTQGWTLGGAPQNGTSSPINVGLSLPLVSLSISVSFSRNKNRLALSQHCSGDRRERLKSIGTVDSTGDGSGWGLGTWPPSPRCSKWVGAWRPPGCAPPFFRCWRVRCCNCSVKGSSCCSWDLITFAWACSSPAILTTFAGSMLVSLFCHFLSVEPKAHWTQAGAMSRFFNVQEFIQRRQRR